MIKRFLFWIAKRIKYGKYDSRLLQRMIDSGGCVYLGPKEYVLDAPIELKSSISIIGIEEKQASIINASWIIY